MNDKTIVPCRAPTDRGTPRIHCPNCQSRFILMLGASQQSEAECVRGDKRNRLRWITMAITIVVLFGGSAIAKDFDGSISNKRQSPSQNLSTKSTKRSPPQRNTSQWIRISYNDLINKETITHSGQTIGVLLDKRSDSVFSDVQPYLEPFSFVCNDIVASAKSDDKVPFFNIVAEYQTGSRQPAWAALFREGHYQLFVGNGKARLFLKGKNPSDLFIQYYSVIRHPLKEALVTTGVDKMVVEIYAFENDYISQTIKLNLKPHVIAVSANQLKPRLKTLPISDLAKFFDQGITLEAAEIDGQANFFLYGAPSAHQTIADQPQSLEDFAVVYRSMFHHGQNPPYISLDHNEDNRYAKVNFGGLLENTRVGSVVLEADKLFKTLSTGLDPNTRSLIKQKITHTVPDFMTEDERGLREETNTAMGHMQIRYWFYPDQIRTVTDGRIGVVESYQFLADAERMDKKVTLGRAQRDTIDHLNRNFGGYARALPTYQELNSVARIMAIVKWLQQSSAIKRVDLDALLSVELSPFKTPMQTKKLLAVTVETQTVTGSGARSDERQKVYCLDNEIEGLLPTVEDKELLDMVNQKFSKMKDPDLVPVEIKSAESAIDSMESKLEYLRMKIDRERLTINRSNKLDIDRFNSMISELNSTRETYNNAVRSYNAYGKGFTRHSIVSVGGGINLRPKDFAKPMKVTDSSPLIKRIRTDREIIRSSPIAVTEMDNKALKRKNETVATKNLGTLTVEQSTSDLIKERWTTSNQRIISIEASLQAGYIKHRVAADEGYFSEMTVKSGKKEVVMATSVYPNEIVATGNFSQGGIITLHKGKKIERLILPLDSSEVPLESKWVRSGD